MPVKQRTPKERDERQAQLERYREMVREGAPCPTCGSRRNERCGGGWRKRNHVEREQLFERWCREQAEAERLEGMLGRINNRG